MTIEIFVSDKSLTSDQTGVFEHDGDTGYFYLCGVGGAIVDAIHVMTGPPDFAEDDVEVRWSLLENKVGLFIRGVLWALFDTKRHRRDGGGYQRGVTPTLAADAMTGFEPAVFPAVQIAITPLIQALRDDVDGCAALLDEHLEAFEELLPHIFFGSLVALLEAGDRERVVRPALAAIERALAAIVDVDPEDEWKDDLLTLLWTSFFENFEPIGPAFEPIRGELGPLLEAEYQGYMHATRPSRI